MSVTKYRSNFGIQREVPRFASGAHAETTLGETKVTNDTSGSSTQTLAGDAAMPTWGFDEQLYADESDFFDSPGKKYSGGVVRRKTGRGSARSLATIGKHNCCESQ